MLYEHLYKVYPSLYVVRKAVCNKTKRKTKNEMAG